ncbi:circadian associated repressor of transcription a isoform X1 [Synchiropus splendidus]|uniref:circadian associated repressor of transcription a isoform X1 n=1 Tax=Synchiropus splendidus TaxID=270530 RepID=UPI00237E1083|nr:circadian associated repressor of transcription a isoform X1 [Synchiropus splendidus]
MMNTLESSKWLFYNSPPSTPCNHFSESEHTEDEADVSEGEWDMRANKPFSVVDGASISFLSHPQKRLAECKKGNSQHCLVSASADGVTVESPASTPGNVFFAKKCADLHRFIYPLHQLLHRLKTGRYNKGLTTSQKAVAIDRLQRILGMLQRPEMGSEKHLHNLLQIEMMLKMWFPHVAAFQSTCAKSQTPTPRITPHWQQNQLHMPVKKRKLNWVDPDNSSTSPDWQKNHGDEKHSSCPVFDTTCLPRAAKTPRRPVEKTADDQWSEHRMFPEKRSTFERPQRESAEEMRPPSQCSSPCTQENSISSSSVLPQLSSTELVTNWMSRMPVRVKTEWIT